MSDDLVKADIQPLKGVTNGVLDKVVVSPSYKERPAAPKYPRKAQRKRQEGTVLIRALVNANGEIQDVILYKSSGYESLDESALKAVSNWLIKPAIVAGRAVAAWVEIPVIFSLR